jgi:hypothetical protein
MTVPHQGAVKTLLESPQSSTGDADVAVTKPERT